MSRQSSTVSSGPPPAPRNPAPTACLADACAWIRNRRRGELFLANGEPPRSRPRSGRGVNLFTRNVTVSMPFSMPLIYLPFDKKTVNQSAIRRAQGVSIHGPLAACPRCAPAARRPGRKHPSWNGPGNARRHAPGNQDASTIHGIRDAHRRRRARPCRAPTDGAPPRWR